MANEKILILEAPWSDDIDDTQATRDIYTSAETLLRLGPNPVRIIQRPLVSTTYLRDIRKFVGLSCNRSGPNVVIFSAHGSRTRTKYKRTRRELEAFDACLDINKDIRCLKKKLKRTIIILDSCGVGKNVHSFRKAANALGAIGFAENVDWVDSSVFVPALLLHFQEKGIFHLKRARKSTPKTEPKSEEAIREMLEGAYKSFKKPLGINYSFGEK